jgi:hypothetical protein
MVMINFHFSLSTNPPLPHLKCLKKYLFVNNVHHCGLAKKREKYMVIITSYY